MTAPITYQPPAPPGYEIIHLDELFLVADKASGLLSVPGRGEDKLDCLASRIQSLYPEALTVHRLDMETSGLIVLARSEEAHRRLSRLFRERQVEKRYIAVVAGRVEKAEGEVDLPLIADWPNRPRQKVDFDMGKPCLTRYRVLQHDAARDCTQVELEPVTGRSHQLRLHMQALGHPILGDRLYAPAAVQAQAPRLMLHAACLAFPHPTTGEPLSFASAPNFPGRE